MALKSMKMKLSAAPARDEGTRVSYGDDSWLQPGPNKRCFPRKMPAAFDFCWLRHSLESLGILGDSNDMLQSSCQRSHMRPFRTRLGVQSLD